MIACKFFNFTQIVTEISTPRWDAFHGPMDEQFLGGGRWRGEWKRGNLITLKYICKPAPNISSEWHGSNCKLVSHPQTWTVHSKLHYFPDTFKTLHRYDWPKIHQFCDKMVWSKKQTMSKNVRLHRPWYHLTHFKRPTIGYWWEIRLSWHPNMSIIISQTGSIQGFYSTDDFYSK